jgi:hypothetical protein
MADEGEKVGMAAAVALAIQRAGAPVAIPEEMQLPLLPPAEIEGEGEADGAGKRGPGRPPGARNKRTMSIVTWIERRYPSPLEAMAGAYSKNVYLLAAELGLKSPTFEQLAQILEFQLRAATALAPYLHQKQPVAVQVDSRGIVRLILEQPGSGAPIAAVFGSEDTETIDIQPLGSEKENDDKSSS